jgi:hypothetical protein
MSGHNYKIRSSRDEREDESTVDRFKKALWWMASFIFLAIATYVFHFLHVLLTDPAVRLIWKEVQVQGQRVLRDKFGSFSVHHVNEELEHD